jgi:hypothetical protein
MADGKEVLELCARLNVFVARAIVPKRACEASAILSLRAHARKSIRAEASSFQHVIGPELATRQ